MLSHCVHAVAIDVLPLEVAVAARCSHLVKDVSVREGHEDASLLCADAVLDFFEIHEDIFVKEAQLLKRGAINHKAGAKDEIEWLLFSLTGEAGASGEVGNVSAAIR